MRGDCVPRVIRKTRACPTLNLTRYVSPRKV